MKYLIPLLAFALAACDDSPKKTENAPQAGNENPLLKLQNDTVKKVEADVGAASDKTREALDNIDKQ